MSGNILVPLKNWKKFLWAPSVKHASEFADILKQSNYLNFQETNVTNNMFYFREVILFIRFRLQKVLPWQYFTLLNEFSKKQKTTAEEAILIILSIIGR